MSRPPTFRTYISSLEATPVSRFNRDEQRAYWINLYNAATTRIVLDHYPVASVRDISLGPGLFSVGPLSANVIRVEGERLSLDDIEHTPAAQFGACFDSLWLDLSKGLGCPVGAVLAGDNAFIQAARSWKFRLGGAMRQAVILAAGGLYALDHHVLRLSDDHDVARRLASRFAEIEGVRLPYPDETNIVFLDIAETGKSAEALSRALAEQGIGIGVEGKTRLRAVTHLDVDTDGVDEAANAIVRWIA